MHEMLGEHRVENWKTGERILRCSRL